MLKSLRSARLLAGLALFALGLPLVAPTVQACAMGGMDMRGLGSGHHAVVHDGQVGNESAACRSTAQEETLEREASSCCGQSSVISNVCASDRGNNEPAPLLCDCRAADSWPVANRSNDSPATTLALHETGEERVHLVPASRILHSSLKDPGAPPLDRTIVFGSFLA